MKKHRTYPLGLGDESAYSAPLQPRRSPEAEKGLKARLYRWVFREEMEAPGAFAKAAMQEAGIRAQAPVSGAEEVRQALRDWKASAAYFEDVSEPELVDYAVYGMEAAQKRYVYLLRNARRMQAAGRQDINDCP